MLTAYSSDTALKSHSISLGVFVAFFIISFLMWFFYEKIDDLAIYFWC